MRIKWFSLVRIVGLSLVLLYHFFQGVFPGGFIGVDVFFAFSGFLITSLLIDEFARSQEIDIKGFLMRRFYRIFPPLVFMILITLPFTLFIRKDFVASIGTQIAGALGFVTNFYEMLSGGNYESQFIPHLFVHTWSLALEVHYYILWAIAVWFIAKNSRTVGQFRGMIFLVSTGVFLFSFLSMFISGFFTKNFSLIYFSSWTHIFPFFAGTALATISGVKNVGANFKKLEKSWSLQQTLGMIGSSFAVLLLLGFLLRFDNIFTYLVGFLFATIAALIMILGARVLHEKTPQLEEPIWVTFIADTSYGVYLFHWPFYIIFSQLVGNIFSVLITTILSFAFAAVSFYILEPVLAGRKQDLFGIQMDVKSIARPIFYSLIPLAIICFLITVTAPKVGAFEEDLMINALHQADSKLQLTRSQADQTTATDYNVASGTTLIGDSVALRANEWLQEAIPGIQLDAVVSRNLESGLEVYQTDISNRVLLQNVVLALGTNTVSNYEEALNKLVEQLPKGHRLILVTPYDGRVVGDANSDLMKTRQYQIDLAKKYDYVYVADWYQTAMDNPAIWYGTDYVHFGVDATSIAEGGRLYAQTIKTTLEEANKGPVKP